MKKFLVIAACSLACHAHAGVVIDDTISGWIEHNFEHLPTGNISGLFYQEGATYGERFAGQTIDTSSGFDVITGTPTSLTLLENPNPADNIGIALYDYDTYGNVIHGDLNGMIGEGALSILLDSGSDVFGMTVGGEGGQFRVQFFAADGRLIGSIAQAGTERFYGFRATAGDLIRGVSITNTDFAGIGIDNVTFNQNSIPVPEPESLALFGLGMLGFAATRRRRQ